MGKLDATDNEVYNAAIKANAHEFIINLHNKYETKVGERSVMFIFAFMINLLNKLIYQEGLRYQVDKSNV